MFCMCNYKTTLVVVVILDYVSNHSISMKFFGINNIMLMKIENRNFKKFLNFFKLIKFINE